MESPWVLLFIGPLMANAFMCNIEEQLENQNKMPTFYKRYADDTLSILMPDVQAASTFLSTLNEIHPSISFTMELEKNGKIPFLGMEIIRNTTRLDRKVYRKPTDAALLLHYHSHVNMKYKHSLLKTILNRGFKLSSNWQLFHQECERLKEIFTSLYYPEPLIQNTIKVFIEMKVAGSTRPPQQAGEIPVRIPLPFKDQRSANKLREQLSDLSRKKNTEVRPVFTSRKIKDELRAKQPTCTNLQLSTSKTLYIPFSVICVMQIMSALQADTYINVSRSINDR
ncbi:uncharacterized protein [Montipora foliosa]|uniref:uncharacterized protein n=1 Tax=Montipora foliosa TaxID=591990 RepID=UPI0035F175B7